MGRDQRIYGRPSEHEALHSSRDRDQGGRGRSYGGGRGRGNYGTRDGDNRAPRKPANQVERPVVFSFSSQVQAVRDILISLHGPVSIDTIHHAVNAYAKLGEHTDIESDIADVLTKAFASLSLEIPAVATVVAVVYGTNQGFMHQLLGKMTALLCTSLSGGDKGVRGVFTAKMLLKSLSCLVCCKVVAIEGDGGIVSLLNALIDVAMQAQSSTSHIAAYLVLSTLPLLIHLLPASLLLTIETLVTAVQKDWSSPFDVSGTRAVYHINIAEEVEDTRLADCACWDNLWSAASLVSSLLKNTSLCDFPGLSTPWTWLSTSPEDPCTIHCISPMSLEPEVAAHLSTTLLLSTWLSASDTTASLRSWRNARIMLFEETELGAGAQAYAQLPSSHKHILGELVRDVLVFFKPLALEDGTRIGSVQLAASHALGVSRHFEGMSHAEYGVVETLLGLLLQPDEHDSVYLCSVLLELCKIAPSLIPPIVAIGCGVIFQLTPALDTCSWRGVARYLQLHLVNFKLVWPYWSNWADEVTGATYGEHDAMRGFCGLVVDGCARVVYRETVISALPPALKLILDKDYSPALPLFTGMSDSPQSRVASHLAIMLANRESAEAIEDWLDSDHDGIDDSIEGDSWKAVLLVQGVLHAGAGVLSHTQQLLDAYRDLLRSFLDVEDGQKALMLCLADVYNADGGTLNFVIDATIRRSILMPDTVCQWVMSTALITITSDVWIWSHIVLALDRSIDTVRAALAIREQLYMDDKAAEKNAAKLALAKNVENMIPGLPAEDDDDDDAMDVHGRPSLPRQAVNSEVIEAANLSLLTAARSCGDLFDYTLAEIVRAVATRQTTLPSADDLDPLLVTLASLFRHVLRTAKGASESLATPLSAFLPPSSYSFFDANKLVASVGTVSMLLRKSLENAIAK